MASEPSNRTPNGFVVFLGTTAAFIVVAVVFVAALGSKRPANEVEQRRAAQRVETRNKVEAEAQEKLNSDGWVDKAKGTVHIPIKDAMTLVVAELNGKKPAPSSVKVEPPLPMPTADPNSTEPAPAALPSAPQGADTIRFTPPAATPAPAPVQPAAAAPAIPIVPPAPAVEKPAAPLPAPLTPTENPAPTK